MMPDTGFLLRGVVIWFILFNYLELLDVITAAIEGLKNVFPVPDVLDRLNNFASSVVSLKPTEPDPGASPVERLLDSVQGAFNFHFGWPYWVASWIESGITLFIRLGYEKIRAVLLAFLTVAGPLSLTLSVIPGMEKVAGHWFRGWFVVHMWSVTLRILDSILVTYNQTVFATAMGNGETAFMDAIIINVVCVLMYLMVPSLTTYFVGYAATGGFFGKLAGVISTTAAAAAFGAGVAGKVFGGSRAAGSSTSAPGQVTGTYPSGGGPFSPGGAPTGLPPAPQPLGLPPGGGYLLGGGSQVGFPPGPQPLPPLQGGNALSIPVRQLPVSPQQRPSYTEPPVYIPYEPVP
jgi:hypothetical protein